MTILVWKRRPYTGNLNSETSGDSKNAFPQYGDVLGVCRIVRRSVDNCRQLHCPIVHLSISKLSIVKIALLVLRIGVECEHSSERFV